jgi:hypothetical protein
MSRISATRNTQENLQYYTSDMVRKSVFIIYYVSNCFVVILSLFLTYESQKYSFYAIFSNFGACHFKRYPLSPMLEVEKTKNINGHQFIRQN